MSFLVIEGIDGVGKTTVINYISEKYGLGVVETPEFPYSAIKQQVVENESPLSNFLFFMAGNVSFGERFLSSQGRLPVICVRYLWSTIAYTVAKIGKCNGLIEDVCDKALKEVSLPDKVVMLTACDDALEARYMNKPDSDYERSLRSNTDFRKKLLDAYEYSFKILPVERVNIDTSMLGIEDVAHRIVSVLKD